MSNQQKPRILVIDDWATRDRKSAYSQVLEDDFEVSYIENGSDLYLNLAMSEFDLYLIDIVLSGWVDPRTSEAPDILSVLREVPASKPIILISNAYETLVKQNKLTPLMNEIMEGDFPVTEFIVWSDFEKAEKETFAQYKPTIVNKIKLQLFKFKGKTKFKGYTVGIVAALESELKPFLDNLDQTLSQEFLVGNTKFTLNELVTGTNKKIKLVIARQHQMGMVECAYISSIMATQFDIQHLFMIGVCGGRDNQGINIGDLIIPKESVTYQNGKLTNEGLKPDYSYASSNSGLMHALDSDYSNAVLLKLMKDYQEIYQRRNGGYLGVNAPKVSDGEMACGDYIIDKDDEIDKISLETGRRKMAGVEMESYSILRLPILFPGIKATVMKSVMDLASNKSDKFKDYAAYISANFLITILKDEKYNVLD